MSEPGEFIDATLRAYGSSVGAIRATVRDATRKFRGMTHDEITALASELWSVATFERRLAAIVVSMVAGRLVQPTQKPRLPNQSP